MGDILAVFLFCWLGWDADGNYYRSGFGLRY